MTKYKITKPIFALPPLKTRTIRLLSAVGTFDFTKQTNGICTRLVLQTGAAATNIKLNDEGDSVSVIANSSIELTNVHIESITTDQDISLFASIADISDLAKAKALKAG